MEQKPQFLFKDLLAAWPPPISIYFWFVLAALLAPAGHSVTVGAC